jgi:protein involved in temperature-dependent protein secretion
MAPDKQQASAEAVKQNADGDLEERIRIEIQRRQLAENGRADGECFHEVADHDARRHALEEGVAEGSALSDQTSQALAPPIGDPTEEGRLEDKSGHRDGERRG